MGRKVICTNNDVIILGRQIDEFQQVAENLGLKLPAQVSYCVHKNEQMVMQKYSAYEKRRMALLESHAIFNEKGEVQYDEITDEQGQKSYKAKFKDEKLFDEEFQRLLIEKTEIEFFELVDIEKKIEGIEGNQKALNQLWYLLEVFANWNPANMQKVED